MTRTISFAAALTISMVAFAATPPARMNYQGVLRDASDAPLTGTYDMVFSFWDAATGGNEILDDAHTSGSGGAVSVAGGLFNAALGGGTVSDGPGAGSYTSLDQVFRDFPAVWLEVRVGVETLSPRTQISASAYALNATNLNGQPSSSFMDLSSASQTKLATATFDTNVPYSSGVVGKGGIRGGDFYNYGYDEAAHIADGFTHNGVWASGSTGVHGEGTSSSGYGVYGTTNGGFVGVMGQSATGVYGSGSTYGVHGDSGYMAGYFNNTGDGSLAQLSYSGVGVEGFGHFIGGYFQDLDAGGAYADLGYGGYTVTGSGTKAFRQNHPYDPTRVVVYNSLEGNEAGTYTRGSAKLVKGEARIALDPTFAWTTNPDVGLTASATVHGDPVPLGIASLSTTELVVRGPAGSSAQFDYVVYGLRIGFEELPIVQSKDQQAPIPSMTRYAEQYAAHPDLRPFNALERFLGMRPQKASVDLSASVHLRDAINAQTPAGVDAGLPRPKVPEPTRASPAASRGATTAPHAATRPAVVAPTFPAPAGASQMGVAVVRIAEPVEPGDVVAADPAERGAMRPSAKAADPLLGGVVAAPEAGTRIGPGQALLAVAGSVVSCRVDATYGAIHAGDLLTSSPTAGHAMRVAESTPGTILGKALEDLEDGTGTINVLVMSR